MVAHEGETNVIVLNLQTFNHTKNLRSFAFGMSKNNCCQYHGTKKSNVLLYLRKKSQKLFKSGTGLTVNGTKAE
jgi:hypothetical protein